MAGFRIKLYINATTMNAYYKSFARLISRVFKGVSPLSLIRFSLLSGYRYKENIYGMPVRLTPLSRYHELPHIHLM